MWSLFRLPEDALFSFTSRTNNPDMNSVSDVSPEEVASAIAAKSNKIYLVDVRENPEFTGELGHISAAHLIVLGSLPDHVDSLPKDKSIVFICKSGGRSARAAAFAQANGLTDVYNMRGGMLLWNSLKLPIQKD